MQVTWLNDVAPRPRKLAVGEFDGVHVGHREVIRGSDTVLTFEPHPLRVLRPEAAPRLLTSLEAKAALIESLGVQEMVVIPFDESFAAQSAQAFIDDILIGRLQATQVAVGENFRFGHRAHGDTELLQGQAGFTTRVVPLVEVDGEVISSSRIRALVTAGEVDLAQHLLGAPFVMYGEVAHGDKRGRTLGFPTANLVPDEQYVCPGHGIYAARADGRPACVSIGVRPTFGLGRALLVEAFLLDFSGDLYGHILRLDFLQRLRGEKRFDDVDQLVAQMHADIEQTRRILA